MEIKQLKFNSILFYTLLVMLVIPVWVNEYPGMVDFPQHVTQTTLLLGLLEGDELFNQYFEINWYTPYIIPNLIALFFAYFFSPLVANKILVSVYIVSAPILTQLLTRSLNRPSEVRFLTLPFVYGFAFHWGFVPFLMSSAISAIWIWYYFTRNQDIGSKWNIFFSFIVMYSHAVAWGVVVFIILAESIYSKTLSKKLARPYILIPLLPLFVWLINVLQNEISSSESHLILYKSLVYNVLSLVGSNFMGNDWLFGTLKFSLIIIAIIRFGKINRHEDRYYFIVCCLCLLFIIMPNTVASIAYFSDRLLVFFPVFLALSIYKIRSKNMFVGLMTLATLLSIGSTFNQQHNFNLEVQPLMGEISPNIDNDSRMVLFTNLEDYGKYEYQILPTPKLIWAPHNLVNLNKVISEYSFAFVFPEMVRFKTIEEDNYYIANTRYKYPNIKWSLLKHLDYVLIRDCSLDPAIDKAIQHQSEFESKVSAQCWHLYEKGEL